MFIFVHVEKRHFKSELEKSSIFGTTDFVISMYGNFSNVRQLLAQVYRDKRERRSPLTEITLSSFPHLGKSQRSAIPKCNGIAWPWGNYLCDHS